MSRTILTKTQTVLALVATGDKTAEFLRVHEDDADRDYTLGIDLDVWFDLGSPHAITVTIEPGDRLND